MLKKYLLALVIVLVASPVFAQVLYTQEWDGSSGSPPAGWSCSFASCPILETVGSPSGGKSLAANMAAGTYPTNGSGGIYTYDAFRDFNRTEYYQGFWIKWSANFVWFPASPSSKFWLSFQKNTAGAGLGTDNAVLTINTTGTGLVFTQQLWRAPNTSSKSGNVGSLNIVRDRWYWVEIYMKENTMAGPTTPNADGEIKVWFDDVLKMDHRNAVHRTSENNVFGGQQIVNIWGGGCSTCTAPAQSIHFDHVVFSTSRIGMPGGNPQPVDTINPTAPTTINVSMSGTTASVTTNAGTDSGGSGLAGHQLFYCNATAVPGCTPNLSITTLNYLSTPPTLSHNHTGLANSTSYRYAFRSVDGGGLTSGLGPIGSGTTDAAAATYRNPLCIDNFDDRAGPALGTTNWTGSYTGLNDLTLISGTVRVGALDTSYYQTHKCVLPNNQYAKVQLQSVAGSGTVTPSVTVRGAANLDGDSNACTVALPATSRIERLVNGTPTTLVTNNIAAWTWAAFDYPFCEAEGTTFRFYAERAGIKTLLASTTDATYASGVAGLKHRVEGAGAGQITYVGGQTGSFAGSTSPQTITFNLTGGTATVPAAGDFVVIHYGLGSTGASTTLHIRNTSATDYDIFGSQLYSNDQVDTQLRSAYRVMPGTPETQFVLTSTGGGTGSTIHGGSYVVQVFRGVHATPLEQAVQQGTGLNTHLVDFGSITPATTGTVVIAVGAGGLEVGGVAYASSDLTSFRSPASVAEDNESSIGAGFVNWTSGAVAPANLSGGGTAHAFNSYAWSLIALKPSAGGTSNTIATAQLDRFEAGEISSTSATVPTITSIAATTSTITIGVGVAPTSVRLFFGNNQGGQSVPKLYSDFTAGVLSYTLPLGTTFLCAYGSDQFGVENTTNYVCMNTSTIIAAIDTAVVVFGTPFPSAVQPVGTTEKLFGVPIDKPAACRASSTDQAYADMELTMTVANNVASYLQTGLTDNSTTTRYIRCSFPSSQDPSTTYVNTTSAVATIVVDDATPDPTPPADVANVTATAITGTTDIRVDWPAAVGATAYQAFMAAGACDTYQLFGNPVTNTLTASNLQANTVHCFIIKGLSASAVPSVNFSNIATTTSSFIPDTEDPSQMQDLRVIGSPFSRSVQAQWRTGTDNAGPVLSELQICTVGVTCPVFTVYGARVSDTQLTLSLTPSTDYLLRGRHIDTSERFGAFSAEVPFTTAADAPQVITQPRLTESEVNPKSSATRSSSGSKLTR